MPPVRRINHHAAVRRYWWVRCWLGATALLLIGASVSSHRRHPDYATTLAGREVDVVAVIQGDFILVGTKTHATERVRLKYIDAPDLTDHSEPSAHFSVESRDYLDRRLRGKRVILSFDGLGHRDEDGCLAAYVHLGDNECVNLTMVRYGYAYVDRREHGYLTNRLGQAEGEARRRNAGLWKDLQFEQMPPWRQAWLRSFANP